MKRCLIVFALAFVLMLSACSYAGGSYDMWDGAALAPGQSESGNTEEYNEIVEQGFLPASQFPLSTFSIDVDTASYTNVRNLILEGLPVEQDAVRIEEFLNYFDYDYEQPADGEAFSVRTEVDSTPWNPKTQLLSIGIQGKTVAAEELAPSNLVVLVDVSGSMDAINKLPLVKRAVCLLADRMQADDYLTVYAYSNACRYITGGGAQQADQIKRAVNALSAGGGTGGYNALQIAYDAAAQHYLAQGNNRVIIASDGDFNIGPSSQEELKALVQSKGESGIYLTCLGFGRGNYKDNRMETMAQYGNGNYYYVDSADEADRLFTSGLSGMLHVIAKDVKVQLDFNPAFVKGYRLIGYDNRLLSSEDFADERADAGEMGSGHRVTVLYEVVPAGSDFELAPVQGGGTDQSSLTDQVAQLRVRYRLPDQQPGETSREFVRDIDWAGSDGMSQTLRFQAALTQFAMILRNSRYSGTSTLTGCIEELEALSAYLSSDPQKVELLNLVKLYAQFQQQ